MFYCHRGTLVNRYPGGAIVETMPCRCWTCDKCRSRRRRELIGLGVAGQPDMLLTLTISSKTGNSSAERAVMLSHGWRRLRRYIMETLGHSKMPFLAVFEEHKSGEPHLHILCRSEYIPRDQLVEKWIELTGSWNVDIRRVSPDRAGAKYICKYVGKNPTRFEGTKRYWKSQDYLEDQPVADEGFQRASRGVFTFGWIENIVRDLEADGYEGQWDEDNNRWYGVEPRRRGPPREKTTTRGTA